MGVLRVAIHRAFKEKSRIARDVFLVKVSIIVPAYNEEINAVNT